MTELEILRMSLNNANFTIKQLEEKLKRKNAEIERTLKDVAFSQSVEIGKTKPLGDTGSPKSYRNWERKERKLLERVFLK